MNAFAADDRRFLPASFRGPHSNGDHKDATSHPIDPDSPPSESADLGSSLRPESGRKQEHIKVWDRALNQ